MKPIRLLVVDDHAIVRKGIQMTVSTDPVIHIVGEAADGEEAIHLAKSLHPDVILMDFAMPRVNGVEAAVEIKRFNPNVKVIIFTVFADETRVTAAMKAGVDGYLLKSEDDGQGLLLAIKQAQYGYLPIHPQVTRHLLRATETSEDTNGKRHLTEREKEVLQLMAKGLSNKDVAHVLNLTNGTVKIHVSRILHKLHVNSRTEAVIYALERELRGRDWDHFLLLYIALYPLAYTNLYL